MTLRIHHLAWAALLLAACVIVFGAFVRLSHAGLSCPDWPTCYGQAAWPTQEHEVHAANQRFERPVETGKAWREQLHRHVAALLGLLVLGIALLATRARRHGRSIILGAAASIAVAIALYMRGQFVAASVLAALGVGALAIAALRWNNRDHARLAALLLAVVVLQALLGMWTVTWLLKPVVVLAHLLGGLTTFALLAWLAWRSTPRAAPAPAPRLRGLLLGGLLVLAVQIALGGWVSANYAALACGSEFPTCQGRWLPATDFAEGFVLWRGIGVDYEGGVLDAPARTAIHLTHRWFALLVFGHLLVLGVRLLRSAPWRGWGGALCALLLLQIGLGIGNVLLGLPLWIATAHNAGAVGLLFVLVSLLARAADEPA